MLVIKNFKTETYFFPFLPIFLPTVKSLVCDPSDIFSYACSKKHIYIHTEVVTYLKKKWKQNNGRHVLQFAVFPTPRMYHSCLHRNTAAVHLSLLF